MSIFTIGRTGNNVRRLGEIVNVLARHSLGYLVHKLNLGHLLHLNSRIFKDTGHHLVEQEVEKACEELGPTFVKFGQLMSMRTDMLPLKFTRELSKLQDSVKPFPFAEVKKILEAEYRQPILSVFSSIDEKPRASASIAQVHRAKLKSGEQVAVKVQYPDIEALVTRIHMVNSSLSDAGWGPQLLCSVFGLAELATDALTPSDNVDVREGASVGTGALLKSTAYLVYLFKRGTFYPFVPTGHEKRSTEEEFKIRSLVADDLHVEADLDRWFPLWDLPVG